MILSRSISSNVSKGCGGLYEEGSDCVHGGWWVGKWKQ